MQLKVINPYAFIGTKHKEVLDFIGNNLPPDPTFEQLNAVLVGGSFTSDPDHLTISGFAETFAGTILPNVYNSYVNGGQLAVSGSQLAVKAETAGIAAANSEPSSVNQIATNLLRGIKQTLPADMIAFLDNKEETIVSSGLSVQQQIPLFIALSCARASAEYWHNQITTPGIWAAYLDLVPAISYTYLPLFVAASAQGALLSYGIFQKPEIQLLDVYVSQIGASGLCAGRVVFGWTAGS